MHPPVSPVVCRFHPTLPFCHGGPPIIVRRPPVILPPVAVRTPTPLPPNGGYYGGGGGGGYSGGANPPSPVAAVGPAAPSPTVAPPATPPVCTPNTTISIVFQPSATVSDVTSFLASYGAQLGDGPDKDGVYRLRLGDSQLTQEQVQQVIESMRTQTTIVNNVGS